MSNESVPADIREFVFRYIDSIELLNVLLLLQANPGRSWSVGEINNELRSSNGSITKRLEDLYHRQILQRPEDENKHKFTPVNDDMRKVIEHLVEFHRQRPYTIIEAIFSRPAEALRAFADAFKFKGEK